jgi:hypothetical protein
VDNVRHNLRFSIQTNCCANLNADSNGFSRVCPEEAFFCKSNIGGFLFFAGIAELISSFMLAFIEGLFFSLVTLLFGTILLARSEFLKDCSIHWNPIFKKVAYGILAIFIILASLAVSVRTTTNLMREDHLQNYQGSTHSNVELNGTIFSVTLNQEVQIMGYAYHIFRACVSLNITSFVWIGQVPNSDTPTANYLLNTATVEVYYDWVDASKLNVGQTVIVKGCYCPWNEDSIYYSDILIVDPAITDSYIKPVTG